MNTSSLFGHFNQIWTDLDRMLKIGRKVDSLVGHDIVIGSVKLDQHIDRLERLIDNVEDKIGPNADAAFGILELGALCEKAVSELLSDFDNGVIVKIRLERD